MAVGVSTITRVSAPVDAPADRRVSALDGYRAVAAFAVVLSHTAGEVGFITKAQTGAHLTDNLGNFGVAVFFVLSGFVNYRGFVAASLGSQPLPDVPSFLARRAIRIYPGYWVALVFWAIAATDTARAPGSPFAMFLLLDPYNTGNVWLTGLYVSWSLTVEIAFYLFLPAYAMIVDRIARRQHQMARRLEIHLAGLVALVVVAYGYRMMRDHWSGAPLVSRIWLPAFFDWFALGMVLAVLDVWRYNGGSIPAKLAAFAGHTAACWTCAAAAYVAIVVLKGDQLRFARGETPAQMSWRFFFQGLAAFFLVLPAILGDRDQRAMRLLAGRRFAALGAVSYGIYLWHPVVMLWFHDLFAGFGPQARVLLLTVAVVGITVPVAFLSHRLVEMPFMLLYDTIARRRASAAAAESQTAATA